jgi:hypothetical protein
MNCAPNRLSAAALVFILAGCGNSDEAAKPQPSPPPPKETVFDDMIATKERAKQTTERATEQVREKHEAAMKEVDGTSTAQ